MNEEMKDDGKAEITFQRVSLPDLYCEAYKANGHTYALIVRPGPADEMTHRRFEAIGHVDHKVAFTITTEYGKNVTYKIGQRALTALTGRVGKRIRFHQRRENGGGGGGNMASSVEIPAFGRHE